MPSPSRPCALIVAMLLAIGSSRAADGPAAFAWRAEPPPTSPGALGDDQLAQPTMVSGGLIVGDLVGARRDVRVFKGVPYAAPPTGARRWRSPQPVAPWSEVRRCDAFGPACPQPPSEIVGDVGVQSEDCLTLNLWTPARRRYDRYPVIVWLHGGSDATGAASLPEYDGQHLARLGCVVVTVEFRLGPLGFLAHPRLDDENDEGVSGNYGLLDEVAALEWVRDNVGAFGGDPGRVTLAGSGARGGDVCRLMVSPLAAGLFHGAIVQSGGVHEDQRHLRVARNGLDSMETIGVRVAHALGCDRADDPLAALRAVDARRLVEVAAPSLGRFAVGARFGAVVDGWAIPFDPALMWNQLHQARVPLIVGANADEGRTFLRWFPTMGAASFAAAVRARFAAGADEILARYAPDGDADAPDRLAELITDASFAMPARALADDMDRLAAPCWRYRCARAAPAQRAAGLGAAHGAELPYVFGTLGDRADASDLALSATLRAAWVRFAATGDPNGGRLIAWPTSRRGERPLLAIGDGLTIVDDPDRAACDELERLWIERSHLVEGAERAP